MADNLNPVKPKVTVDGNVIQFESLRLEQRMNDTHFFEVVCEFMSRDELWKQKPSTLLEQVGSEVVIHFEHVEKGGSLDFNGYVTDVQIDSWDTEPNLANYGHQSNRIHLIGHGKVVKLDNVRGMDSYVDTTLQNIFDENKKYTSKAASSVVCSPKFTNQLPYVARYNESLFDFFNRLSYTFGELFFYDGEKLSFGKPNDSAVTKLVLGNDLLSLRTTASATPRSYMRYDYMNEDGKEIISKSNPKKPSGLMGNASRKNELIYDKENKDLTHSEYPISQEKQLTDLLDSRQKTADGSVLNVEGITHTCRLKLGGVIEIGFPGKMGVPSLGKYRIMYIEHTVDKMGNYSNYFEASPMGYEPVRSNIEPIKAYPEVATVTTNSDPKNLGRVQVQFDWQKPVSKNTNWIRVQSPDAGGSGAKNRGMVFVPEVGDQVMVGFEFGDPNRPYVMGSMFNGRNALGGGESNNIHSIITKSGRQIILDDGGDGGITIDDNNGNTIQISTSGGIIEINSTQEISLHSKIIRLSADEDIIVSAGKNYEKKIGGDSSTDIKGKCENKIKGNFTEDIEGNAESTIKGKQSISVEKDLSQEVSGKMSMKVSKDCDAKISGKLSCEVSKDGKINSKSKLYITGGSNVYVGK